MKPKNVTLAFKHWFSEAGFSEVMVFDFSVYEIAIVQFAVALHLK
jgi:hypothetical protein